MDDEAGATGTVGFVGEFFESVAVGTFACTFGYGAFDGVFGHVLRLGVVYCQSQTEIHVRVVGTLSGGDGDFAREFGEELAALGVGGTLLVLDGAPLRMA